MLQEKSPSHEKTQTCHIGWPCSAARRRRRRLRRPQQQDRRPETRRHRRHARWIQSHPAGDQTRLGNLPLNAVLHPDGRHLLVTNNGQGVQSLQLIDTDTNTVVQTLPFASPESLYIGLAWSPDGKTAYASAAANSKIRVLSFAAGQLTEVIPSCCPRQLRRARRSPSSRPDWP